MNRSTQVDILRALAVYLVVGRHLALCPETTSRLGHAITAVWERGGWIGVDLFFVLSGFLVSGLLFREHEKYHELHIGHFLIRRGFKIYPPFWFLIGVTVAFNLLSHLPMSWHTVVYELLFVQNYKPGLWNHTWSLAVEEHFYLLLSLGFFLLCRRQTTRPFHHVPGIFLAVATICLALRFRVVAQAPFDFMTHVFPSHLRLDSLFFGVLLSFWYHQYPAKFNGIARRFKLPLFAAGLLLVLPPFWLPLETTPFLSTYGLTLIYLGSGCLLVSALGIRCSGGKISRSLAYVGSHSYSIYLWHMPVMRWGPDAARQLIGHPISWFSYATISIIGTTLFGIALALLIEFPTLRLRDRFFPSRGRPLNRRQFAGLISA